MEAGGILALPIEIIQDFIFEYLADIDIYNLGQAGNKRIKEICEHYIKIGRCTYT